MRYIPGVGKEEKTRFTVDALDEDGAGVGDANGLRLHVPRTLPNEVIEAVVEHRSPHGLAAWGRLVTVVTPSDERVPAACAAWGRCGGCVMQHLAIDSQRSFKRDLVEAALVAAGVKADVQMCEGGASLHYRNRAKLVFARAGERVILGAYAPRSHEVIDLAGCQVVAPPLDGVAQEIARLATDLGVLPYDERSGLGDARYAILRANREGQTQVTLVVARRDARGIAELARALRRGRPEVTGVVENLNASRGNALVAYEEPDLILDGNPMIEERVGVSLTLSPRSFFQASAEMAERLYGAATEAAGLAAGDVAIDLYTGVGGIALSLAQAAPGASVIGVEEIAEAVADAAAGALRNNLSNVRFICADATKFLSARAVGHVRTDVVTVDPPRKGLSREVTRAILELKPRRLVYVSCAPRTLARDLALLVAGGYQLRAVTPFDLMPHTPHVEALAVLDRD